MEDRHNPERALVRCVGDEVVPQQVESQRTRGQVRAAVPDVWRPGECTEGVEDLAEAVGSVDAVFSDVFSNLVDVREGFRVESVTAHAPERRCVLFSRSRWNASSPLIGFTRPLLRSS